MTSLGENTWIPEDDSCPSCGHFNCFRVKHEGVNEESFAKCFSEDLTWDVVAIVAHLKEMSNVDAAKYLAKKYKINLPVTISTSSPIQEIFDQAALYYSTALLEAGPCAELNGLTPLEYQLQKRLHTRDALVEMQVGWSDGKCVQSLISLGMDPEIILSSGLINRKSQDYLPTKCFIYPHKVRGRTSHFTFKDPTKRAEYQLPNKFKLNSHIFYNSDSLTKGGPVMLVEGENDVISLIEAGWVGGILGSIGTISATQVEWLVTNLAGRDVITLFDSDPAGDKYRAKVRKVTSAFNTLLQIRIDSGAKDIDEYLKLGGDLKGLLSAAPIEELSVEEEALQEASKSNILIKKGSYHKIKMVEGVEQHIKLSNFTIQLLNIYLHNGNRDREIIVIREDGMKSDPIKIPSEAKVSLKPFRTLMANAVDASFYGREEDMTSMWEHVYSNSKEKLVHLPDMVGRRRLYGMAIW